jgi:hypothetical protein
VSLFLGIDIASVDGDRNIDWKAVAASGCRFAIFRGGLGAWTDPTWAAEAGRAQEAGLIVGVYLMPDYRKGGSSAGEQVDAFRRAVGTLGPGYFPPALDVEFSGGYAKTGRSRHDLLDLVVTLVADLRAGFGVAPMIYTSARVWDGQDTDSLDATHTDVDLSPLADCVPWIARYPFAYHLPAIGDDPGEKPTIEHLPMPPAPKLWGWCAIHQDQGDAQGFAHTVRQADVNRFFAMRAGDVGPGVSWLQRRLSMPERSGVFDAETVAALAAFQDARGLVADAVLGPLTFSFLAWSNP